MRNRQWKMLRHSWLCCRTSWVRTPCAHYNLPSGHSRTPDSASTTAQDTGCRPTAATTVEGKLFLLLCILCSRLRVLDGLSDWLSLGHAPSPARVPREQVCGLLYVSGGCLQTRKRIQMLGGQKPNKCPSQSPRWNHVYARSLTVDRISKRRASNVAVT